MADRKPSVGAVNRQLTHRVYKEERDVLEEMRKIDDCDTSNFSTFQVDNSKKTIAILGDGGDNISNSYQVWNISGKK